MIPKGCREMLASWSLLMFYSVYNIKQGLVFMIEYLENVNPVMFD